MQLRRILPPLGQSSSPGPGGGRHRPVKTAAISALHYNTDNCVLAEEAIRYMPLPPIRLCVDKILTADVCNKVDSISRRCSCLLALSAQHHHSINPRRFLMGGTSAARRGYRGVVPLQDWLTLTAPSPLQRTSTEAGFQGGVYGNNMIASAK